MTNVPVFDSEATINAEVTNAKSSKEKCQCFVPMDAIRKTDKTLHTIINRESFLKRENWYRGIVHSLLSVGAQWQRAWPGASGDDALRESEWRKQAHGRADIF